MDQVPGIPPNVAPTNQFPQTRVRQARPHKPAPQTSRRTDPRRSTAERAVFPSRSTFSHSVRESVIRSVNSHYLSEVLGLRLPLTSDPRDRPRRLGVQPARGPPRTRRRRRRRPLRRKTRKSFRDKHVLVERAFWERSSDSSTASRPAHAMTSVC